MLFYMVKCMFCKREFKLYDNDPQYRLYKRNKKANLSCLTCKNAIESDARKMKF